MEELIPSLLSFLSGAIGGGLVSWFIHRKRTQWEIKREAGLAALDVADAVYSNMEWRHDGKVIPIAKQPVDIVNARRVLNELVLTCKEPSAINAYFQALGVRGVAEEANYIQGDGIGNLRNTLRKELGFGKPLDLDPEKSFLAILPGTSSDGS